MSTTNQGDFPWSPLWEELNKEAQRQAREKGKRYHGRTRDGFSRCPSCGKESYGSRKLAKAAARLMSRHNLSAYRCSHATTEVWHLGNLPSAVRKGKKGRGDIRPLTLEESMGERILKGKRRAALG